jgi:hypothetical protein
MPKGVEHIFQETAAQAVAGVFLPLMPKGVEHCGHAAAGGRESFSGIC